MKLTLPNRRRARQAANDGAVRRAEELELSQDDLDSKRLIFGEHYMTVAVYARTRAALDDICAEVLNIAASTGIDLISEGCGARAHYMARHPDNTGARSRKLLPHRRNSFRKKRLSALVF